MKNVILLLTFILSSASIFAQQDKILGIWWNEEKDGKIEVYKKGDKYYGKIIWIKNDTNEDGSSPKLDSKNPEKAHQTRPVVGTNILIDLEWDEDDNEWDDGEIYDPKSGNTYDVYAKLKGPETLYLKGYIGISIIGRSTLWTRAD